DSPKSIIEGLIASSHLPAQWRSVENSLRESKAIGPALLPPMSELASVEAPTLTALDQILESLSPLLQSSAIKPQPPGKAYGLLGVDPHHHSTPTVEAPPGDDAGAAAPKGKGEKPSPPVVDNSQGDQDKPQPPNASPGHLDKPAPKDKDNGPPKPPGG